MEEQCVWEVGYWSDLNIDGDEQDLEWVPVAEGTREYCQGFADGFNYFHLPGPLIIKRAE